MYHYRSVAAGMMIGLAGLLNLSLGGIPGAIAFGLGLLAVCKLQLDLFTGKMGAFLDKKISIKELLIIFAGNFAGILLIAILGMSLGAYPSLQENAKIIMGARYYLPFGIILIRGVICGICVQLAVNMWQSNGHPFLAMLPATAFVILGCNHCIADMLYLLYSGSWGQWYQIFEAMIGNVMGAILFSVASLGIQEKSQTLL